MGVVKKCELLGFIVLKFFIYKWKVDNLVFFFCFLLKVFEVIYICIYKICILFIKIEVVLRVVI